MVASERSFLPEAAVESILYIASKVGHRPTIHEVLKIRYEADKLHLARYGWMASGDAYSAMRFGPVASNTYNLLKAARGDQSVWIHPRFNELVDGVLAIDADGKTIVAKRKPELEMLSSADVECLDEAVRAHEGMTFAQRTQRSHDEAYRVAYAAAVRNDDEAGSMSLESIAAMLPNKEELLDHLNG